jgi:hypothetical protein
MKPLELQSIQYAGSSIFQNHTQNPHFTKSDIQKNKKIHEQHTDTILDFINKRVPSRKEDFDLNSPQDFIDLCLEKAANEETGLKDEPKISTEVIRKIIMDLFFFRWN